MINNHKVIAIITARSGSKGLPKKNIKELHGKPLIAWTIDSARKSKYLDKVIVSTDCKDISKVAMQFGAEVPFIRPLHLASDDSTSFDRWLSFFFGKIRTAPYDISSNKGCLESKGANSSIL